MDSSPITAATRYCAVYGHPIRHSASPAMQNAGIATLGLDWRYLAFAVHPDDFVVALAGAKALRFIGINLTVPHKLLAMNLVDVLDPTAQMWGAVNTVRFETRNSQGQWCSLAQVPVEEIGEVRARGFNTDAEAFACALREDLGLGLPGARVLVLGAGGAGRVAALRVAADGAARLWLVNRTASKAEALAGEIGRRFPATKVTVGYPAQPIDLILNATSLGLKTGDGLPLDEARFPLRQASAVYDMIYQPTETPLLRRAKAVGCRTANGLGMLLHQGAQALELWTGKPAPLAVMRQALESSVYV